MKVPSISGLKFQVPDSSTIQDPFADPSTVDPLNNPVADAPFADPPQVSGFPGSSEPGAPSAQDSAPPNTAAPITAPNTATPNTATPNTATTEIPFEILEATETGATTDPFATSQSESPFENPLDTPSDVSPPASAIGELPAPGDIGELPAPGNSSAESPFDSPTAETPASVEAPQNSADATPDQPPLDPPATQTPTAQEPFATDPFATPQDPVDSTSATDSPDGAPDSSDPFTTPTQESPPSDPAPDPFPTLPSQTDPFETPSTAPAIDDPAPVPDLGAEPTETTPTESPITETPGQETEQETTAPTADTENSSLADQDVQPGSAPPPERPAVQADTGSWLGYWPFLLLLLIPLLLFALWRWMSGRRVQGVDQDYIRDDVETDDKIELAGVQRQATFEDSVEGAVAGLAAGTGITEPVAAVADTFDFSDDADLDLPGNVPSFNSLAGEAVGSAAGLTDDKSDESVFGALDVEDDRFDLDVENAGVDDESDMFNFGDDDNVEQEIVIDDSVEVDGIEESGESGLPPDSGLSFNLGESVVDSDEFAFDSMEESGDALLDSRLLAVQPEVADSEPGEVFSLTADESVEDIVDDGLDQLAYDPVVEANAIHEAEIAQARIDAERETDVSLDAAMELYDEEVEAGIVDSVILNDELPAPAVESPSLNLDAEDDISFELDEEELAFDDEPVEGLIEDSLRENVELSVEGNDDDLEFDFSEDDEYQPAEAGQHEIALHSPDDDIEPSVPSENGSYGSDSNQNSLVGAASSLAGAVGSEAEQADESFADSAGSLDAGAAGLAAGIAATGAAAFAGSGGSSDIDGDTIDKSGNNFDDDSGNSGLATELNSLRSELERLRAENSGLSAELQETKQNAVNEQAVEQQADQLRSSFAEERNEMNSKIKSLKELIESTSALKETETNQVVEKLSSTESLLQQLQEQLDSAQSQLNEKASLLENAQKLFDEKATEAEEVENERLRLSAELTEIRQVARDAETAASESSAFQNQLAAMKTQHEEATQEKNRVADLLSETKHELISVQDQLTALEEAEKESDDSPNLGSLSGLGSLSEMAQAGGDQPKPQPAAPTKDDSEFFKRAVYERKRRKKAELRVEKLKALLEEAEEQGVELIRQLKTARTEAESVKLNAESNSLSQDDLIERDREIETLKTRLKDEVAAETGNAEKLELDLEASRQKADQAKLDLEELKTALADAREDAEERASKTVDSVRAELETVRVELESKTTELKAVRSQESEKSEAAERLNAQESALKAELAEYQARASDKETMVAEQTQQLAVEQKKSGAMQSKLDEAVADVDRLQAELLDTRTSFAAREEKLARRETELSHQSSNSDAQLAKLTTQFDTIKDELFDTQSQLLTFEKKVSAGRANESKIESLQGELDNARSGLSSLETELARARSHADESARKLSEQESVISESATTSVRLAQVESALAATKAEFENSSRQLENERAGREKLTARLESSVDAGQLDDLKRTLEAQIVTSNRKADAAVKEKDSLAATIEELNIQIRKVKSEKAEAVKDAEEKRRLISKLESNPQTASPGAVTYLQSGRNELVGVKDSGADASRLKLELNEARQNEADLKKQKREADTAIAKLEKSETSLQSLIEKHLATIEKLKAKPAAKKPTPKPASNASKKKPAAKSKTPKAKKPENLQLITGIGKVFEQRLNELGVTKISEIARWSKKKQAEFDESLQSQGRITEDDWVGQAKDLVARKKKDKDLY